MRVWVFGDSFCDWAHQAIESEDRWVPTNSATPEPYGSDGPSLRDRHKFSWWNQIRDKFGCIENQPFDYNLALSGSSIDYMVTQFEENEHLFESGDIVIVGLTDWRRKWIIEDSPTQTNVALWRTLAKFPQDKDTLEEYREFIMKHFHLLHRKTPNQAMIKSFVKSLPYVKDKRNLKTIVVLNCFDQNLPDTVDGITISTNGSMFEVSRREKVAKQLHADRELKRLIGDFRPNHLCWENHTILADKVEHAILTNSPQISLDYRDFVSESKYFVSP